MRVLVTGAGGLVGRWVVRRLVLAGDQVHAVSRSGTRPASESAHWHAADLLDAEDRRQLLARARPDAVVHLAWETTHGRFWHSPLNETWEEATIDLVSGARDIGTTRVVVAGTCAEYDWTHLDEPGAVCHEYATALRPATPYGAAKLRTLERLSAMPGAGTWLGWGRVFSPYGPGEDPARLLPSLVLALLDGRPATVTSPGLVRDYLHADEVARGLVALLGSSASGACNVASGHGVSLGDLAAAVARAVGRPDLLRLGDGPPRADEPARLVADIGRLRDEVGFQPRTDLGGRMEEVVAWWRDRPRGAGG